jgi:hypothetical protein
VIEESGIKAGHAWVATAKSVLQRLKPRPTTQSQRRHKVKDNGKVKDARLKSKSRRPLQSQGLGCGEFFDKL